MTNPLLSLEEAGKYRFQVLAGVGYLLWRGVVYTTRSDNLIALLEVLDRNARRGVFVATEEEVFEHLYNGKPPPDVTLRFSVRRTCPLIVDGVLRKAGRRTYAFCLPGVELRPV